jgi:hypothetical protein
MQGAKSAIKGPVNLLLLFAEAAATVAAEENSRAKRG